MTQFAAFEHLGSNVSLFPEDCVSGMRRRLDASSIDVFVTSPPYNLGIKYSKHDDSGPRDAYLSWMGEWADEIRRVLRDDGSLFLNIGGAPKDPWIPYDVAAVMRKRFTLQNTIHWIKSISIEKKDAGKYDMLTGDASFGHFKPINSKRYLNDCQEFLFHFTKTGDVEIDRLAVGVPYQDKTNIGRWKAAKRDLRCRGNTWFVPYKTIMSRDKDRPHPATFPVELARKAIRLHGLNGGRLTVCDPFLGIGHAGIAALHCKADFIGFEIDEAYFNLACEAIRNAPPEDEARQDSFV